MIVSSPRWGGDAGAFIGLAPGSDARLRQRPAECREASLPDLGPEEAQLLEPGGLVQERDHGARQAGGVELQSSELRQTHTPVSPQVIAILHLRRNPPASWVEIAGRA